MNVAIYAVQDREPPRGRGPVAAWSYAFAPAHAGHRPLCVVTLPAGSLWGFHGDRPACLVPDGQGGWRSYTAGGLIAAVRRGWFPAGRPARSAGAETGGGS